ncbi:MAG: tRNA (adenosine(37)-N6)-threonylcarbamoyltransferase complex dimerization subunit type 1 TsaB [Firmicutes bacterium]|nr:tRNA (adenosine(37)-N6)-threonylcarbamoyltransferase complex dimerization subunit type 1 TsaB [Bacillota bacterium]
MKVLALDTSALVASVAVMDNWILLGEYTLNHKKTHSQKLILMIEELLANLELSPNDIDLFAVSKGPGSFTGLRIGVTTVKTMAYALDKPVVGVPTLDVLAYNIPFCRHIICPIMDARNNQVYTALYQWASGEQQRLTEYMGVKIEELVKIIRENIVERENIDKIRVRVIFTGDGVIVHRAFFSNELGDRCTFAPYNLLFQRASSVAEIALNLALKGESEDCFSLVPFYLRKSQAERMREIEGN